ncbi:mitochondrial import inner membrane translocase subunit tim17 domain-contraining [Cyclospora cayetanensis]|uniref:Mitochondrial import inner membrane translocase subunit tim17 domain-contraining n=1 Tax=Cyclospora cayetanensis TaxID=88456 RepID=A0A1D3D3U8_9EIME|nr:mitochondrial import inner membrane translocase subunit tim17 domain-contraining [Cyclospora cayetanensis]
MSETSGGNPNSPWVPDSTGNGSREDAMPTEVYGHPMSVFLMPRYRSLCLLDTKGEAERREAIQQLRAQRAVERFLNDGCLVRAATMGVGGGLLGILFGAFFFTMKPVDVDTTLGFRAQLREQYKSFVPEVASTAKNFAKIGALFSFCECIIDKFLSSSLNCLVRSASLCASLFGHREEQLMTCEELFMVVASLAPYWQSKMPPSVLCYSSKEHFP